MPDLESAEIAMPSLAEASLTPDERIVLDRFLEDLKRDLGDDLVAVWLGELYAGVLLARDASVRAARQARLSAKEVGAAVR